jgi:hypothetical protein
VNVDVALIESTNQSINQSVQMSDLTELEALLSYISRRSQSPLAELSLQHPANNIVSSSFFFVVVAGARQTSRQQFEAAAMRRRRARRTSHQTLYIKLSKCHSSRFVFCPSSGLHIMATFHAALHVLETKQRRAKSIITLENIDSCDVFACAALTLFNDGSKLNTCRRSTMAKTMRRRSYHQHRPTQH